MVRRLTQWMPVGRRRCTARGPPTTLAWRTSSSNGAPTAASATGAAAPSTATRAQRKLVALPVWDASRAAADQCT
ncbi:hypothetical protein DIPPA_09912 [Diplonema papillatum]|nr:hypothetical protein DIPPA_09912 [Diplonema papillatum]